MFTYEPNLSLAEREERILAYWKAKNIFQRSLEARKNAPTFSFYDGPPFATGLPHYGHLLAGTIKDSVQRYKTMRGFYVPRRFGWDCHGLPVENEIEKAKELSGAAGIEAFGIAQFNEECRSIVQRYTKEWEGTVARMGRWVSFENSWRTMDLPFMESVWWVFASLYDKGLIYEGYKVMPFSTKLGTPLSNFEANLNYKDVDDPSLTIKCALVDEPHVALLIWTTTPWTLPSNLAVLVGRDIDYVRIKEKNGHEQFILAKDRVPHYFKDAEDYEIVGECKGRALQGKRYHSPFSYYRAHAERKAFRILLEDAVAKGEGTGLVHAAPAFGEVDFFACARAGIEPVCPVDQNGKFTEEVRDFAGMYVKDADREIIRKLKQQQRVFHIGQVRHRYPFCWRSDTPLIYKAVRTWFVAVEKIKDKLLEANRKIHWVPGHIKEGRFGKWLENARDWAISRSRYWGTPIPLWRNAEGDIIVISSVAELEKRTGQKIHDLHRHFIDALTFEEKGTRFERIPDVFDCWFESGSMPYAQDHYPFEHEENFSQRFPAEFIAEGIDQTRGWFYTLTVLAAALYDQPAFKHVIVNGIILAEDGTKMSKRLKNYPEPTAVIRHHGADALRLYLLSSAAVAAEDMRFSEKGVEQIVRGSLLPLWNAFVFFTTYARIYAWHPTPELESQCANAHFDMRPQAEIDRWILSRAHALGASVQKAMDHYALQEGVAPLLAFVEELTDWYIRRSRARFWADEHSQDRDEAFATLYAVLVLCAQVAAPFIPFLSEAIFLALRSERMPLSVHLCAFPMCAPAMADAALDREMALVKSAVSAGHALRKAHKLKVRQPLRRAYLISAERETLQAFSRHEALIAEELNVKEVVLEEKEESFVTLAAKPNFRVLGKKVGALMPQVKEAVVKLSQTDLRKIKIGEELPLDVADQRFALKAEDLLIERTVKPGLVATTSGDFAIALETELDDALLREGVARELINKINTMRREEGFDVTDRITVHMETPPFVQDAYLQHEEWIKHEVLATSVFFSCTEGREWDLNGHPVTMAVSLSVVQS